ncbi:gametogenetin-binding protein 2-like isoform X2 [Musca domestica]|uniref:Gametogenetin-binding protein 2-like isoform X2 n=1 Tax=Musca domestica TaxID=7370 RepID=A0ABM3VDX7_MUSDO|nr:gametogenetin-binding protein 2-like isoform X2 [Musca domestica]
MTSSHTQFIVDKSKTTITHQLAQYHLNMLMDLNSKGLCIDSPHIRGKELEEFTRKFNLLTTDELHTSLEISSKTFVSVLNQCVQCVGCRRLVERLFYQLSMSGHPTLDPLVLKNSCVLSIAEEKMKTPQALGTLLYRHHEILNNLLESKLRNKTRCVLHSLDAFRSKPFSETWREVWSSMKHNCREELAVVETKELREVLENYLKKHKFCNGCRTKIEKAYKILVGETTPKEKGYVPALYANIKKCHPDKHIHIFTNKIDFLDALIRRAEPEVNGSYSKLRERHAKTLEIAQEEVLTCVGMIMYERLRRVYVSLREEERACQVLAAVGVHALCQSFDMSVEKKQGISNLELLYQEISRAEKAKEHKREQKKLKKKKKKNEKKNSRVCGERKEINAGEEEDQQGSEDEDLHEHHGAKTSAKSSITSTYDDGDEALGNDEDEEEEYEGEEETGKKRHVLAAGQKSKELEEDAGVECDHLEGNHEDDDADDVSSEHHKPHSATIQNPVQPNTQQQKKKKQKQKQKLKTPQKKNSPTNIGNGNNNSSGANINKNKEKSQKSELLSSSSSGNHQQVFVVKNNNSSDRIAATTNATTTKCNDCHAPTSECPCESDIKDSGYGSEPLSHGNSRTSSVVSSPEDTSEGSEVSCSDGFCNHERTTNNKNVVNDPHKCHLSSSIDDNNCDDQYNRDHYHDDDNYHHKSFDYSFGSDSCKFFPEDHFNTLSLQQMLDDFDGDDEAEENCYIPHEVVLEYQCQREKVQQQRLQLRETLRENFARLCMQQGRSMTASPFSMSINKL